MSEDELVHYILQKWFNKIDESSYLLDLEQNWDDEDGEPVDRECYRLGIKFLRNLATRCAINLNNSIPPVSLGPRYDGVDIWWLKKEPLVDKTIWDLRTDVLINICKGEGEYVISYYGISALGDKIESPPVPMNTMDSVVSEIYTFLEKLYA